MRGQGEMAWRRQGHRDLRTRRGEEENESGVSLLGS